MKAIMISINPKWVAKILNGEKTVEIRKRFPKDYRGWVYIYCTKGYYFEMRPRGKTTTFYGNGKVVARFYCDNVEEINKYPSYYKISGFYYTPNLSWDKLEKVSCLSFGELNDYLKGKTGYAIHISNLEIFDKPKKLSEFRKCYRSKGYPQNQSWYLTKAPQSWQFIETGELL